MTSPDGRPLIANKIEAEKTIANLEEIMDQLERTLSEETTRVRAGRLRDAVSLDDTKTEFSRLYVAQSERLKSARDAVAQFCPEALDRLHRRHDNFQSLLKTNLTVLATAHAVSEGILRGVSGELARKQAPSTYGASGRAQTPGSKVSQPLAFSRTL